MDFKQNIILQKDEVDSKTINGAYIIPVTHRIKEGEFDNKNQTYYFKVRVSPDACAGDFFDNMASFYCENLPLKGRKTYTGSRKWINSYSQVNSLWDRGNINISVAYKDSEKMVIFALIYYQCHLQMLMFAIFGSMPLVMRKAKHHMVSNF